MLKTGNQAVDPSVIKTNTSFKLGSLQIGLLSNSQLINQSSQRFLNDWTTFDGSPNSTKDDIQIYLKLVERLPHLPDQKPAYQGDNQILKDGIGTLSVYNQIDGYLLSFLNSGLVHLVEDAPVIQGFLTVNLLKYNRLYDLIFTSLSPFLRQRGYYLVHGSAAVNESGASIFVGPIGSAKSTTVLNLALNGWKILCDDTILLEERADGIYALPTPGAFSVRPQSLNHIPFLKNLVPQQIVGESIHLPLSKLGLTWGEPAPVSTIYFPTIDDTGENQFTSLPTALALAHLMELSLDRWDKKNLSAHINFLEKLCYQAKAASLKITNQQHLPKLLHQNA